MAGPQSGVFRDIDEKFNKNGDEHRRIWEAIHQRPEREEVVEQHDKIWAAMEALRNRLPLWATILITILTSIVAVAIRMVLE